ncbi:hypothetical protein BGZ73_007410 [Actinomortierella ambigua]|nr:hypothetical protein BGZ73_007410 [Actinomortierella ambigua]
MSAPEYYPLEKGNLLASKGDADMYMIGRRLATRYNQFLDKYPYDGIRYDIRSSDATRCTQSAHGFTMGLLEGRHTKDPRGALANQDATTGVVDAAEIDHGQIHGQSAEKKNGRHSRVDFPPIQPASIYTIPKGLDQELAVKYSCPRWLSAVADHPLVSQHEDMYIKNHVQPIADRLTQLFFPKTSNNTHDGVHKDGDDGGSDQRTIITTKDVQLIYQMCGYEMSFYDDHETWCQLLWKPHHPRSHPHRSSAAQAAWSEIGDNDDNSDSEEDENEETEEPEWERTMTDPVEPESKHSHHHGSETSTLDDLGLDFLHLEYLSDLGDYYGYGPGVPFNQHLARPLARGLIDSVDKILNTTTASETLGQTMSPYSWTVSDLTSRRRTWTHPPMGMGHHVSEKMFLDPEDDDGSNGFAHRAVLKFGHSETGLYDDGAKQPPRGDQSGLKESDRAFRASVFSPFAANMILEVYRPLQEKPLGDNREVDDKSLKKPRKYRGALVRLLVNEVPHAIPGCGNTSSNSNNDGESHSAMDGHDASLFCEWSILRAKLIARGADQGFEQCCEIENGALAGAHGCSSYNFSQGDGKTASGQCLSTEPFPLVG